MIKTKKQLRVSENMREQRLKMCMVNKQQANSLLIFKMQIRRFLVIIMRGIATVRRDIHLVRDWWFWLTKTNPQGENEAS